jgi:hypothetical protein
MAMSSQSDVAYCGLFCGDCIIRTSELGSRAGQLLDAIKTDAFRKVATGLPQLMPELREGLAQYDPCCRALDAMRQLDCRRPCKNGGGSEACPMKQCCQTKAIAGCWQCETFETCETLAWLRPVHQDAHLRNPRTIRHLGIEAFLQGEKHW